MFVSKVWPPDTLWAQGLKDDGMYAFMVALFNRSCIPHWLFTQLCCCTLHPQQWRQDCSPVRWCVQGWFWNSHQWWMTQNRDVIFYGVYNGTCHSQVIHHTILWQTLSLDYLIIVLRVDSHWDNQIESIITYWSCASGWCLLQDHMASVELELL